MGYLQALSTVPVGIVVGVHSVLLVTIKISRIHDHSASYLNTKIMITTYHHHEGGTTPNYVRSPSTFFYESLYFYLYLNLHLNNEFNNKII